MSIRFSLGKCKSRAGFSAKLQQQGKLNLDTIKKHFKVLLETPILLVHGTGDEVVPVEGSRQAAKALKEAGYDPILKEFPMGHQITEESLQAVHDFLTSVLPRF